MKNKKVMVRYKDDMNSSFFNPIIKRKSFNSEREAKLFANKIRKKTWIDSRGYPTWKDTEYKQYSGVRLIKIKKSKR